MPVVPTRSAIAEYDFSLTSARGRDSALDALLGGRGAQVARTRVNVERSPGGQSHCDREQRATHGLAWLATYVEAIRQLAAYAGTQGRAAASWANVEEQRSVRVGLGEYLAQMQGGIPISQNEIVRPADLGLSLSAVAARMSTRPWTR